MEVFAGGSREAEIFGILLSGTAKTEAKGSPFAVIDARFMRINGTFFAS